MCPPPINRWRSSILRLEKKRLPWTTILVCLLCLRVWLEHSQVLRVRVVISPRRFVLVQ
jgi:hypothetical protein